MGYKKGLFGVLAVSALVLSFNRVEWADNVHTSRYTYNLPNYKVVKYQPHIELDVSATAYWYMDDEDASGTGLAYDGQPAVPYKTIAVDTKVIPLGSKVYVPGIGWCLAHDTGSAIKGNKIDIAMDSKKAALAWGRKSLRIKVILPDSKEKYRLQRIPCTDTSIASLQSFHK